MAGLVSRRHALLLGVSAVLVAPQVGVSADWPKERPIRAIVPFAAGSSTDIIARSLLDELAKQLGQTIVVENRAGASGTIGAQAVATAEPDGYTILVHSSSHTVTPSTFSKLPYDADADFVPVVPLATIPNVVVVSAASNYRTLRDLVDAAKARPGALNYASAGAGSATHLTAERFRMSAGFQAQHVPFKGSSEALTEVIAGRMDFYCSPVNAAIELIRDGRIRALAVSSAQRSSALPEVPTTVEAGYPESGYEFWIGALMPRGTPAPIVERLHADSVKALQTPGLKKKFAELGADTLIISPGDFRALIKREIEANRALVQAAGIQPH